MEQIKGNKLGLTSIMKQLENTSKISTSVALN